MDKRVIPEPRSAPTQSQLLTEQLRQSLLDGAFAAGSSINEVHLARSLQVSRTPLHSALLTLAGEGLLLHTPNRGFTVPIQSLTELVDAYEMRALAEGLAARFAAERGMSEEMRLRMQAAIAAGDRALAEKTDGGARRALYAEADVAFHGVILEAAQSQLTAGVLRICHRVPNSTARNISAVDLDDLRQRQVAHRNIYEAIICREPRQAEHVMRQHILAVKLSMVRWFSQRETQAIQAPQRKRRSVARS
jgi:GntR family transcriptional regulator of vanillate catabolism